MGKIIESARALRSDVLAGYRSAFAPSTLWEYAHDTMHRKAIAEIDDESEFIDFLTANNTFTFPRLVGEPLFPIVIDRFLEYLSNSGSPLDSLPPEIEESPLVSKRCTTTHNGRRISTMFLHHVSVALRLKKYTTGLKKVVEIGGGYGGLAQAMRLFHPKQTYVIVDLLDSLYCSYVFISSTHPNARILFLTRPEEASQIDDCDFVFIPTEHFDVLKGSKPDLIVNTASLGEMTQKDVDAYMHFINHTAEASHFYSINRYAREPREFDFPNQSTVPVKLTAEWEILFWDAFGTRSFHQLDPCHSPQLEILVRKLPAEEALRKARETIAALLSVLADRVPMGGSDWHYCMWEANRQFPSRPLMDRYVAGAEPDGFRAANYYRDLALKLPSAAPVLPDGIDLTDKSFAAAATAPPHVDGPTSSDKNVPEIQRRRGWMDYLFPRRS